MDTRTTLPKDMLLLDVGGTFIKCSDGRSVPVDSNGTQEEVIAAFRQAVWGGEQEYSRLRVAIPGPFRYAAGQFLMKHKYVGVYGEYFADLVGLPRENCRFVHDVNCMLLGAMTPGSGNTALAALGTGLGFAMYVDGQLLENELGSPAVSIFNRPSGDGILEDYVSKRGIVGRYGDPSLTVKEIARRADTGDSRALRVFEETGTILGTVIRPLLQEHGVQTLLLGGQISRSSHLFAPALKACLPPEISVGPISDFDNATFNGLLALK